MIYYEPEYVDERGSLVRVFDQRTFAEQGIDRRWMQQTYQSTKPAYVLRGLYSQLFPHEEGKLVTLLSGKLFWVVVDLRPNSENFGAHYSVTLSTGGVTALLVEGGFAHGCLSLTENCEVLLSADNFYSSEHGVGIAWDDPDIGVSWPIPDGVDPIISDVHRSYQPFKEVKELFFGTE